uniref:Uncharacterized protein n=1 Tax=Phaeodactylum tricornutum TaxID=2850 RepID=A0A8J9X2A1_PHATR
MRNRRARSIDDGAAVASFDVDGASPVEKRRRPHRNDRSQISTPLKVLRMLQVCFVVGLIGAMLGRHYELWGVVSDEDDPGSVTGDAEADSAANDICTGYLGQYLDPYSAPVEKKKVQTIHLIGERHQGTKWITAILEQCFDNSVSVVPAFGDRHKHWFMLNETAEHGVIVAVFRNIYSWVHSMNYVRPHHAPAHFNIEWREFVTRPWTLRGHANFTTTFPGSASLRDTTPCWQRFLPNEIEPCLESERLVMVNYSHFDSPEVQYVPELSAYELRNDGSGEPYGSIVEMRADKIRNFWSLRDLVHSFYPVQYEYMMHNGLETLVAELESALHLRRSHRCLLDTPRPPKVKHYPTGYVDWMRQHVDWDAEALIGYHRDDVNSAC